jgi:hypothetical protein
VTAWALVGLMLGSYALSIVVELAVLRPAGGTLASPDEPFWAGMIWVASWLGFPVVGAVVVTRRPGNAIGWLLVGIGAFIGPGLVTLLLAEAASQTALEAWWSPWAAWLTDWFYAPVTLLLPLLIASFPSGAIRSRLLRRLVPVAVAAGTLATLGRALRPGPLSTGVANPVGIPIPRELLTIVITWTTQALVVFGLLAVVDLVRLFRRAHGVERAQITWFAASACIFPVLFALGVALEGLTSGAGSWGVDDLLINLAFFLGFFGMAVAIGIAVLRYRLFEIDRVVSRTLTYALVTAILAGVYALGVVGLGGMLRAATGAASDLVVAGSTLVVAALFRPVRLRVQSVVDRRFDRRRYDAARTVEAFGGRLRDEVVLDEVAADLRGVVTATMQPATLSLWLRPEGEAAR